jgi:hypothetical protein
VCGSRAGLSGINRPVKNLNPNPHQANQLLSQQNRHVDDIEFADPSIALALIEKHVRELVSTLR